MTAIKLCGLTRKEEIKAANRLMPDFVGFVFWKKSRRALTKTEAAGLKELLDPKISAVGVFVDEDPAFIKELADEGIIDVIQLHGSEDAAYIKNIKTLTGKRVIRAVKIKEGVMPDLSETAGADHILLDAGMGDGRTFDWDIISRTGIEIDKLFLAGGLDPENVGEAIERIHPYAVDVSSGIETDGHKDPGKMEAFVHNARKAGDNMQEQNGGKK